MNLTIEEERLVMKKIVPGVIFMLFISLFGWFGNFIITVSTIHSKKLNSKFNLLIAMMAVADFITQLAHIPFVYFTLNGTLVRPVNFCFHIMLPSLISMNFGTSLIWIIGLDRLLSYKYPIRYVKWRKLPYALVMTSPGVVYCIIFIWLGFKSASKESTFCFISEAYGTLAKNAWVGSTVLINAMVVATYSYLMIFVTKKKEMANCSRTQDENRNRHLLKAIVIIMLFEFIGWFSNKSLLSAAIAFQANSTKFFYIEVYAGVVLNISISCKFYVFYYNSFEYRNAFRSVLCFQRRGNPENGWAKASHSLNPRRRHTNVTEEEADDHEIPSYAQTSLFAQVDGSLQAVSTRSLSE